MRCLTIFVLAFAIIATVSAATDLELALQFLECCRKAIYGGLPEANVPDHRPVHMKRYVDRDVSFGLGTLNFLYHNLTMDKTYTFQITHAEDVSTEPNVASFNYTSWWPELIVEGKLDVSLKTPLFNTTLAGGNVTLTLKDVEFKGVWSQEKPWQTITELKELIVKISVKEVIAEAEGFGIFNNLIEWKGGDVVLPIINNFGAGEIFEKGLAAVINYGWIRNSTRLRTLLKNCDMISD